MPYMDGGSCLHIMKSYHPQGFDEPVIATLLHGALMALDYLHTNGHIHRDVKVTFLNLIILFLKSILISTEGLLVKVTPTME